jgi:hypothetical protein
MEGELGIEAKFLLTSMRSSTGVEGLLLVNVSLEGVVSPGASSGPAAMVGSNATR